jgi:hypothetical protein
MLRHSVLISALLAAALLSACAHSLNVLDRVHLGQSEAEALQSVQATPQRTVDGGRTKYIVYGFIATFVDMYSNTVTHYFVKLENGKVVDKGILRGEVVQDIRKIDSTFPFES